MKEVKKTSPVKIYLTFASIVIVCGLIGIMTAYATIENKVSLRNIGHQANQWFSTLGPCWFVPGLLLLAGSTWFYFRGKRLLSQALEDDQAFAQVHLTLGRSMSLCNLSVVFLFLALPLCYSAVWGIGWSILLLILQTIWMTTIQARIISATKQISPEKVGNIFDLKFYRDWYESCDEAEQQQIAQCGYQTFKVMTTIFPGIMVILAMGTTLGVIAPAYSLLVGGLWLVQQLVYSYTALKMNRQRD